MLDLNRI